jgi:hypothetical protein
METTFPSENNLNSNKFLDNIQKLNISNDPLNELDSIPSINVVNTSLSCCAKCCIPICCCCSDNYKYNISSINGKNIFESNGQLSCKICSTEKISNFDFCKTYSLLSSQQNSSNKEESPFCQMIKVKNSICCGIGKIYFEVKSKEKVFGKIVFGNNCSENVHCGEKEKRCYENVKYCDIFEPNKKQKKGKLLYTIYLRKYIAPFNRCMKSKLIIKNNSGKIEGEIKISKSCNFYGMCKDNAKYSIIFPKTTPELKITIINAVIAIDMAFL